MKRIYWLRGAVIGGSLNLVYTFVTLLIFPIGDCIANDLCGLGWYMVNIHNAPAEIVIDTIYYNIYLSPFLASIITGFFIGGLIGLVYSYIRNRKAPVLLK